jgi:hypothetical protein
MKMEMKGSHFIVPFRAAFNALSASVLTFFFVATILPPPLQRL